MPCFHLLMVASGISFSLIQYAFINLFFWICFQEDLWTVSSFRLKIPWIHPHPWMTVCCGENSRLIVIFSPHRENNIIPFFLFFFFFFLNSCPNICYWVISLRISGCGFNSLHLAQDLACLYNPRIHSFREPGELQTSSLSLSFLVFYLILSHLLLLLGIQWILLFYWACLLFLLSYAYFLNAHLFTFLHHIVLNFRVFSCLFSVKLCLIWC